MAVRNVVACAADGCHSRGPCTGALDLSTGKWVPQPPEGWGIIEAENADGELLDLFVCSPSCERRLARKLTAPRLGQL